MSLAQIADVPSTIEEWQAWAHSHMASHFDIIRVIQQLGGPRLDLFPLDPVTFDDRTWVYNHATMHQQMDSALGIAGYNLTGVVWKDRASLLDFINYNYVEHERANQILRL